MTRGSSEATPTTASASPALVALRRPAAGIPNDKPHLRSLSREELGRFYARSCGGPSYRSGQLFDWLHGRRVDSTDAMSNLPRADRERLQQEARLDQLSLDLALQGADGTRKLRFRSREGRSLESVLIPNDDRGYTQCISSQIGCALTCRFCATASLGFHRNLDSWEIVDQVYRALALLAEEEPGLDHPITNLVFMGMGEPLHNFGKVAKAVELLSDTKGAGLAKRRMTISTSGLVPAMHRFAQSDLVDKVGFAISLNASDDATRDEVMPINTRWPIAELMAAARAIEARAKRELTFEYVLLSGVNDQAEDLDRLGKLLRPRRAHVNLIPFNPHEHAPYQRPTDAHCRRFLEGLRRQGLKAWLRTPRGDDIGAACGQLALEEGKGA